MFLHGPYSLPGKIHPNNSRYRRKRRKGEKKGERKKGQERKEMKTIYELLQQEKEI